MKNANVCTLLRITMITGSIFCILIFSKCKDESDSSSQPGDGAEPLDENQVSDAEPLGENQVLIPHASWDCSMADGIPAPQSGKLVLELEGQVGEVYDMGQTQFGHRRLIEIASGTLTGPNINAEFLHSGMDMPLTLSNGAMEIEQVISLTTDDGALIYLRSCGVSPDPISQARMVPFFEAPNDSDYQFLNTGKFVGTREIDLDNRTIKMAIYDVSQVAPTEDVVEMVEPDDVPDQTWECAKLSGTPGEEVYSETVEIGNLYSMESKYGTRNIVPITGGTTEGRIQGSVLPIGADFQLINDDGFEIDARYAAVTDDGEVILIRNCGLVGALVPVFETREDGDYAWINENKWLSSNPEVLEGAVAVRLTIYESN